MSQEQLSVIVRKPELADYGLKLLWVKAQMKHALGAWVRCCKTPPVESRMRKSHRCCGTFKENAAGGDWDGVNVLNEAIMALAKGKGKGQGSGKGDFRAKGASQKKLAKAEMGSTGKWYRCARQRRQGEPVLCWS